MQPRIIKTAVIGLGIGAQHALAIMGNPLCILSRLVDFDKTKISDFIKKHSLKEVTVSNFDEVINDNDIKLVSIASFDDSHYEQVVASIRANKNVFVEKPLCQTRKELMGIHQLFLEKNCGIASNLVLRTAALYKHVKYLIGSDQLGEIYSFEGDYLYGRIHKITEGWRKNVNNYSVMEGGGIHMIDLMIWLTDQKPTNVVSHTNKIVTKNTSFRYHDYHNAIFTFDSGLIGKITANFGCMHRHHHVVRIFGTKGTFIYDDMGARIHWSRDENKGPEFLQQATKPVNKGLLFHEFVHHLLQNNFINLAQREFDLMSVVLAADEAVHHDGPLKIEYLKC